jgi:hypothetical protein
MIAWLPGERQRTESCTAKRSALFDHLVGGHLHCRRHGGTKRLRGLKIDDVLEFRRLLNRKIGMFFASAGWSSN